MNTDDIVSIGVAALIGVATVHKLVQFIKTKPSNRVLWSSRFITYIALGTAVSLGSPTLYTALSEAIGVPNTARLIKHILAITAFTSGPIFLHALARPEWAARHAAIRVGIVVPLLAAMALAFLSEPRTPEIPGEFFDAFVATPGMGLYMAVYLTLIGTAVVDLFVMSVRYARAGTGLLAVGTWLMSGGGAAGIIYVINLGLTTAAVRNGWNLPVTETLSRVLVPAGAICIVLGLLIPAAAPRVAALYHWPQRTREYRALHSLWLAVYRATPAVVLRLPAHPERNTVPRPSKARVLLLRRIVEIRDGALEARPYLDPAVTETAERLADARDLPGPEKVAVVEASRLAVALAAAQYTPDDIPADPASGPAPLSDIGADDVDSDAAALLPVAQAFSANPVVAAVLHEHAPQERATAHA